MEIAGQIGVYSICFTHEDPEPQIKSPAEKEQKEQKNEYGVPERIVKGLGKTYIPYHKKHA